MRTLFDLAVALVRELQSHGRSRRAAGLALKVAAAHAQLVSHFDARSLVSTADRELALQTLRLCHEVGIDGASGTVYHDLRFDILSVWFDELTLQYANLDAQRLAAQEYGAHVVEWDDYLDRCNVDRHSADGRYVRTLHVMLANCKEAILRAELTADSSARAYIAASEADSPR